MEQPHVYAYPPGAGPSAPPPPSGSPIIDAKYCAPYPVDLNIVRKLMCIKDDNFVVTDVNGNLLFKVKEPMFSLQDKRVLLDASGTPVLTLKVKMVSLDDTWQIFSGDSKDPSKLLFTIKRSMIQFITKLDVFLAQNKEEILCDFQVKGSWFEGSCVVYVGESDTIVAHMQKNRTALRILLGQDNFSVTVYPNFDYAFIVALIVIIDLVNREDRRGGPIDVGVC